MSDETAGRTHSAESYDPPVDVVAPFIPPIPDYVPLPDREDSKPWTSWKTEEDAIAWAKAQLPDMELEELREQFAQTVPDPQTGKKTIAWVERVHSAQF